MLRIGSPGSRPLLEENPRERWTRLSSQRRPTYLRVSNLVVTTDHRSPNAVVREIAQHLGLLEPAEPTDPVEPD
jgi:shikimate kinase